MSEKSLKINCRIFLDAEDVSQSRILSTTSYFNNVLKNSKNPYIKALNADNENDMDEFVLRLYIDETIDEDVCKDTENASMFAPQLAELLSELAQAQSYLEMEGSFEVILGEERESYRFLSESGDSYCNFEEVLL